MRFVKLYISTKKFIIKEYGKQSKNFMHIFNMLNYYYLNVIPIIIYISYEKID